jgi:4-methoxybenzoate monooxygenase (O-demethylating)
LLLGWIHRPKRHDAYPMTSAPHLTTNLFDEAFLADPYAHHDALLVLNALLTRVRSIRLTGQVTRRLNNTLHAIECLPIEVDPV